MTFAVVLIFSFLAGVAFATLSPPLDTSPAWRWMLRVQKLRHFKQSLRAGPATALKEGLTDHKIVYAWADVVGLLNRMHCQRGIPTERNSIVRVEQLTDGSFDVSWRNAPRASQETTE